LTANKQKVIQAAGHAVSHQAETDKEHFIAALQHFQKVPFSYEKKNSITLESNNSDMVEFMTKFDVFEQGDIKDAQHIFSPAQYQKAQEKIARGVNILKESCPDIMAMVNQVVGTIGVYNLRDQDGGSVSSAIGYI